MNNNARHCKSNYVARVQHVVLSGRRLASEDLGHKVAHLLGVKDKHRQSLKRNQHSTQLVGAGSNARFFISNILFLSTGLYYIV
jgi:hypothetical protein